MQFLRQVVLDPPALWRIAGLRVSLSKGHTALVQTYFLTLPAYVGKFCREVRRIAQSQRLSRC